MGEVTGRWLDRDALAQHIHAKPNMLTKMVNAGKLPPPSMHLGPRSPRWDVYAVDAAMLEAAGIPVSQSTDMAVLRACEEISRDAARRKDRQKDARRRYG